MNFKVEYVYELVNKISPAIKKIKSDSAAMKTRLVDNLKKIDDKVVKLTKSYRKLKTYMKMVPGSSFARMLTPFVALGAIVKGVDVIASFGKSISFLEGKLMNTTESIKDFRAEIRKIGRDTRFSAQEVAGTVTTIVKAGITTKDKVFGIVGAAKDLSLVEQRDDLAKVAESILSIQKTYASFGQTLSPGRIVNTLATTFGKTTLDMDRFQGSMKTILALAADAKIPFEEMAAALGLISDKSVYKGTAGTTMKMFVQQIAAIGATKLDSEKGKIYQGLGLDFNKLSFSRQEKQTGSSSLLTTLQEIRKKLINTKDPEGAIYKLFGKRGGKLITYLNNLDAFEKLIKENQKGIDIQKQINIVTNNLTEDFAELTSSLADLSIEAGDRGLTGTLRNLTQQATKIVRSAISGDYSGLTDTQRFFSESIANFITQFPALLNALFGTGTTDGLSGISLAIYGAVEALKTIGKALVAIARVITFFLPSSKEVKAKRSLVDYQNRAMSPSGAIPMSAVKGYIKKEEKKYQVGKFDSRSALDLAERSLNITLSNKDPNTKVEMTLDGKKAFNTGDNSARSEGY